MPAKLNIDLNKVKELYLSGKNVVDIAKELDIFKGTLYKYIRYESWYNRSKKNNIEDIVNKIGDMYKNGFKIKDIILKFSTTHNFVVKCLNKLEIYEPKKAISDKDLIGKTFGRLTVKSINPELKWRQKICLCDCICGNEHEASCHALIRGNTKSCGCIRNGSVGDLDNPYWNKITLSAYNRGIEVTVTQEYCWDLFLKQDRKCAYSGVELFFSTDWVNRYVDRTASLDRIDSSKGYVQGNVQWIHKDINWMKTDFPEEIFIQHCINIAEYQKSKKTN